MMSTNHFGDHGYRSEQPRAKPDPAYRQERSLVVGAIAALSLNSTRAIIGGAHADPRQNVPA